MTQKSFLVIVSFFSYYSSMYSLELSEMPRLSTLHELDEESEADDQEIEELLAKYNPKNVTFIFENGLSLPLYEHEYKRMETVCEMLKGPAFFERIDTKESLNSPIDFQEIKMRDHQVSSCAALFLTRLMTETIASYEYPIEKDAQKEFVKRTLRRLIHKKKFLDDVDRIDFLREVFTAADFLDLRIIGEKYEPDYRTRQLIINEIAYALVALNNQESYDACQKIKQHAPLSYWVSQRLLTMQNRHTKKLKGHTDRVDILTDMGNGKIISGSWDGTVRVWDTETGESFKLKNLGSRWIFSIIKINDTTCALGFGDLLIRTYNIVTNQCLKIFKGHFGSVKCLVKLNDEYIASGSVDKTIRIWRTSAGRPLKLLTGHRGYVHCLEKLNDTMFASGSEDKTIRIWNYNDGKCLKVLRGHKEAVYALKKLDEESFVSGSCDSTLRIWDSKNGACLKVLESNDNSVVHVLEKIDDTYFISGSGDFIKLWNRKENNSANLFEIYGGIARCLILLEGNQLALSRDSKDISICYNPLIMKKLFHRLKN
ncbi:WD40 repeat domain-containing protein [bacterium]|nr:WD40 repeat domain-containing protein [bacterium]